MHITKESLPYPLDGIIGAPIGSALVSRAGDRDAYPRFSSTGDLYFYQAQPNTTGGADFIVLQYQDLGSTGNISWEVTYLTSDRTYKPNDTATTTITTDIQGGGSGSGGGVNTTGADAWCSFDGTGANGPQTLYASYNIKSVTRISSGRYDVLFNTSMGDSSYSFVGNGYGYATEKTVNGFRLTYVDFGGGTANDIFGDFAIFASNTVAPQAGVGADAWINVSANGTRQGSFNAKVTKGATGVYEIAFDTPMPNATYAIVGSALDSSSLTAWNFGYSNQTVNGFRVILRTTSDGTGIDEPFSVAVFASSTITPTYTWKRDGTTVELANSGDDVIVPTTIQVGDEPWNNKRGCYVNSFGNFLVSNDSDQVVFGHYPVGGSGRNIEIRANGKIQSPSIYNNGRPGSTRPVLVEATSGDLGVSTSVRASKTNIEDIGDTSWMYKLRPRQYNFRQKDEIGAYTDTAAGDVVFGFIAEEAEEVNAPICDYNILESGERELFGIHYDQLVVPVIKELQAAHARIEALEAEVQVLKGGN